MNPMVRAALVGTTGHETTEITTGTMFDTLSLSIPSGERELLLKAGAHAVYQLAGYTPIAIPALEAAPEEEVPACPAEVTELMKLLFTSGQHELQILAFKRMQQARFRLTPELLTAALDIRDKDKRQLLYPLLGKRGLWLSQFNPAWSWVGEALDVPDGALPANAQTLWQEGSATQRIEVLRRLRATDPTLARQWIEATWKHEKAELRVELVRALVTNLGPGDELLLDRALDDKAGAVRVAAVETLRFLATSAWAERMAARADTMLTYANGTLKVTPPTAIDASWQRDGIVAKATTQKAERSGWLMQTISYVPPAHWEDRFGISPERLIAAAAAETKWESALLEGWTHAAITFGRDSWVVPLLNRWSQQAKKGESHHSNSEMYILLAPLLPQPLQEETATRLISETTTTFVLSFGETIATVTQPWSAAFGNEYLQGLRQKLAGLDQKSKSADPWDDTLSIAAYALPAECFSSACAPFTVPEDNHNWSIQQFQRQLDDFTNTIQLRARIEKEIAI